MITNKLLLLAALAATDVPAWEHEPVSKHKQARKEHAKIQEEEKEEIK